MYQAFSLRWCRAVIKHAVVWVVPAFPSCSITEVVPLVLKHFEKFSPKLEKESQDPYVYFLAILMETEIYQTHKGKYIADAGDKSRLALLEGLIALKNYVLWCPGTRALLNNSASPGGGGGLTPPPPQVIGQFFLRGFGQ